MCALRRIGAFLTKTTNASSSLHPPFLTDFTSAPVNAKPASNFSRVVYSYRACLFWAKTGIVLTDESLAVYSIDSFFSSFLCMKRFLAFLSPLLVYRHATVSLSAYVLMVALFLFVPTDISGYRYVIYSICAVSAVIHGLVAWRLSAVFKQNADPALYVSAFVFGCISLLFITRLWVGILIVLLVGCILFLTTMSPRVAQFSFPFVHKGWRRLYGVAWMCTIFFFLSVLYGAYLFFASFPWYGMVLIGSVGLVGASLSTIRLYVADTWKQERVMYVVLGALFVQLLSVSLLLPFGLFAFGLLLTWVWYLATLLCRFHASERGILWREQWRYLLIHGLLFISIVFWFLRWT